MHYQHLHFLEEQFDFYSTNVNISSTLLLTLRSEICIYMFLLCFSGKMYINSCMMKGVISSTQGLVFDYHTRELHSWV